MFINVKVLISNMEIRHCYVLNLRNSLPECDVVWFGTNLPTFSRNALPLESEAGKSITFLGNVDILLPDCTASHPSRRWCVHLPVHLLSVCPSLPGPRSDSFVPPRPCHDPEGFPEGPQGTGAQPQDDAAADRHRCAVRRQLAASRSVVLTDTNAGYCQLAVCRSVVLTDTNAGCCQLAVCRSVVLTDTNAGCCQLAVCRSVVLTDTNAGCCQLAVCRSVVLTDTNAG